MMLTASTRRIPAARWRQVMDWSLVLASQGIESEITKEDRGYSLLVGDEDYTPAIQALLQYSRENPARHRPSFSHPALPPKLHPVVWIWALSMALLYLVEEARPDLKQLGLMDCRRLAQGQWWRPFTAMFLHEDLSHLASNLTFGVLFLAFAVIDYGAGPALLLSGLSGALGFLPGCAVYGPDYRSLGASGWVMGALGLLGASALDHARRPGEGLAGALRGLAAAALMLVLIGFSPKADVLAHVSGFLFGVAGGLIWLRARPPGNPGGPSKN